METLSKTPAVQERKTWPPAPTAAGVSDSLSVSSYRDYPARHPFVNTLRHGKPQTRAHHALPLTLPSKGLPETSSGEILSALRNLQEKIRRLELEKGCAELSLRTIGKETSHARLPDEHKQRETARGADDQPKYGNQALITQLAAAETRCQQLEKKLDLTRRMVRHAKADRTSLLKQQVSVATAQSSDPAPDSVSEHVQSEKLERLEREYSRLTLTQSNAERKIRELEEKLQEEEHQRKLVQDKANLLMRGLETNRILLRSVSPRPSGRRSKGKRATSRRNWNDNPSPQQPSSSQPHYRLSLGDVPFVAGTSVGGSHSVRANVQAVLSLLKQHQPQLCNSRVLSQRPRTSPQAPARRRSGCSSPSSSSSSASTGGEELSELVYTLQEELRLMSLEQDELMRRIEAGGSQNERKEIHRDQERLLLKMERKGDQISKLHKHKTQMKKLQKANNGGDPRRRGRGRSELSVKTTAATRGRCAGAVKPVPGERSKNNLRLLKDMKALQTSLRT